MVEHFPVQLQAIVRRFQPADTIADLAAATLLARICDLHSNSVHFDTIANYVKGAAFAAALEDLQGTIVSLVKPTIDTYHRFGVPFAKWWEASELFSDFAFCYVRERSTFASSTELQEELRRYWGVDSSDLVEELVDGACHPLPHNVWKFVESEIEEPARGILNKIATDRQHEEIVARLLRNLPHDLNQRGDLVHFARLLYATNSLARMLDQQAAFETTDELARAVKAVREHLKRAGRAMSPLEKEVIIPDDPKQVTIMSCLRSVRNMITIDDTVPVVGRQGYTIPPWIQHYVFSRGGRTRHISAGPIPYFLVVFELSKVPSITRIAVSSLQRIEESLSFELAFDTEDKGRIAVSLVYALSSTHHLSELMLILLTEKARLDLFDMPGDGGLNLERSLSLHLPDEWLGQLQSEVLSLLQKRFNHDHAAFAAAYLREFEYGEGDREAGFLACENAKSEQIYLDLVTIGSTDDAASPSQVKYLQSRRKLLVAHTRLVIDRLESEDDQIRSAQQEIEKLESQLFFHRTNLSGHELQRGKPGPEAIQELAGSLDTDARCFVHFTIEDGYFSAFWMHPRGDGAATGWIDLSLLDTLRLTKLTRSWLDTRSTPSRRAALDELLDFLRPQIGIPIVQTLRARGIRHVVLSPVWILDALPLHCIPISEEGARRKLLLDSFDSVTYAPSARILAMLRGLGQVQGLKGTAVYSIETAKEIPSTRLEAEALCRLIGNTAMQAADDLDAGRLLAIANGSALLHIACHGRWFADDYYACGLQLGDAQGARGYLSVAQILSEGDYRDTGLVTLACCLSGLSVVPLNSVQAYSAIDSAFLARGARSTLGTLWEIDDECSLLFMSAFYAAIASGLNVEEANRDAMEFLRTRKYLADEIPDDIASALGAVKPDWRRSLDEKADFSHPFFWGAFKCSGWTWGWRLSPHGEDYSVTIT